MFSFIFSLFSQQRRLLSALKNRRIATQSPDMAHAAWTNFQLLSRVLDARLHRATAGLLVFEATHANVTELNGFLQKINVPLSKVEAVSGMDCPSNTHTKNLKSFFVDNGDCYIPMEPAIKELIPHAIELCEYMWTWKDAEPGVEKHNARVLQRLLFSLADLSDKLLECSNLNVVSS